MTKGAKSLELSKNLHENPEDRYARDSAYGIHGFTASKACLGAEKHSDRIMHRTGIKMCSRRDKEL